MENDNQQLNNKKPISRLAIVSFILSLLPVALMLIWFNAYMYPSLALILASLSIIISPLSVFLGIIAFIKIRKHELRGTGFAVACIIIGTPLMLLILFFFVMGSLLGLASA